MSLRCSGLAERAHEDVHLAGLEAEVLDDDAAGGAHGSDRVGLVDEEERAVSLLELDEPAEHSLAGLVVVVGEGATLGGRETAPLDDAVVGELVVEGRPIPSLPGPRSRSGR